MNGLPRSEDDPLGEIPSATVRVAVIGGGVAGCSIAYHLGELGWGNDTLLLEKTELATGASAYAAGDLPQFSESPLVSRLCAESIALYRRLETETGQPVGWHNTGGLRLAHTSDQMRDDARHIGRAAHLGITMKLVDRKTTGELCPLLNLDGVLGAIWTPDDGHIDPASVIMAFATAARARGVRIMRGTKVLAVNRNSRKGAWIIRTDQGTIEAEIVVNAAAYGAFEVSALAGHDLPMTLHEHQYILTEAIPEIATLTRPIAQLRDMGAPFYARQDGQGLLCSAYEATPVFRDPATLPEEALAPDLDRSLDVLERCMARLPALRGAGQLLTQP